MTYSGCWASHEEYWKQVRGVSIRDAALLLHHFDPMRFPSNNRLPEEASGTFKELKRAILAKQLVPFAAFAWELEPAHSFDGVVGIPNEAIGSYTDLASETVVSIADLAAWADACGVPHYWQVATRKIAGDAADYPPALRAAIEAFSAVHDDPRALAGKHPKQALRDWLSANKPELSANARERIASVANWQPSGGAPKTPG